MTVRDDPKARKQQDQQQRANAIAQQNAANGSIPLGSGQVLNDGSVWPIVMSKQVQDNINKSQGGYGVVMGIRDSNPMAPIASDKLNEPTPEEINKDYQKALAAIIEKELTPSERANRVTSTLDSIQLVLGLASFIPIIGTGISLIDGGISAARGDYLVKVHPWCDSAIGRGGQSKPGCIPTQSGGPNSSQRNATCSRS